MVVTKRFQTLKGKLTFSIVTILAVTITVNLLISAVLSYNGIRENMERDLRAVGQTAQVAVSNSLSLTDRNIRLVASSPDIGGSNAASGRWITGVESKKDSYGFRALYVADSRGIVISSDGDYSGKDVSNTDYYKAACRGKVYISVPMKDIAGKFMVITASEVTNNQYQGVVVGEMDPQYFSSVVSSRIAIGKTGSAFILDKTGAMIANKQSALVIQRRNFIEASKNDGSYASIAAVLKNMIARGTGVGSYRNGGAEQICYYQPLAGTDGWSLGVAAPLGEMMSDFYPVLIGMALASAILLLLGILFAGKLAKSVAFPIRSCSERLLLLARGDLHSSVPEVDAADETGDLAKATAVLVNDLEEMVRDETHLLSSFAKGDFDVESECDKYEGDMRMLKISMEQIILSLNNTFQSIASSADQVAGGSGQVSGGAQLLAQGTAKQAGSAEALSKSLRGLSKDIQSNAENAVSSSEKANQARSELLEGSRQIDGLAEAMEKIRASSDKIGKIIKTVQDIAFQTNILALNAAVEAAHAGEAGKGFSVVADEVRNLASKSEKASKEVAGMISEMADAVLHGAEITDYTRKTMLSIVDDTKEIISSVDSISGASQKQSEEIRSITQNMEQISSVVQTNSSTAEESAAASEQLSSQAEEMRKLIQQFRFRGDDEEPNSAEEEPALEDAG